VDQTTGVPYSRFGYFGGEKNLSSLTGIDPRFPGRSTRSLPITPAAYPNFKSDLCLKVLK
jgi:hypothetical protein